MKILSLTLNYPFGATSFCALFLAVAERTEKMSTLWWCEVRARERGERYILETCKYFYYHIQFTAADTTNMSGERGENDAGSNRLCLHSNLFVLIILSWSHANEKRNAMTYSQGKKKRRGFSYNSFNLLHK